MRSVAAGIVAVMLAGGSQAAIFERYLHADRPADRAILGYLELEKRGTATSRDLAELGVLLLEKGFPKDAERYLEKASKVDKENFEAIYRLGLVHQRQGEFGKAIRCYKKVVKMRPGHAYARFMLAMAEERAGRRQAAIRDYAKAYRFAPDLAVYEKNPLLYDSKLQVAAQIERYRQQAATDTLKVDAIDPEAVARMMAALPGGQPDRPVHVEPEGAAIAPAPPSPTPTPATAAPSQHPAPPTPPKEAKPAPAPTLQSQTSAPPPAAAQPERARPGLQPAPPVPGAGQQFRTFPASRRRGDQPLVPGATPTPTPTPPPEEPTR